MPVRKLIVKAFVREVILDNDSVTITHNFNISTKNLKWHSHGCLTYTSAEQSSAVKHPPKQTHFNSDKKVNSKPSGSGRSPLNRFANRPVKPQSAFFEFCSFLVSEFFSLRYCFGRRVFYVVLFCFLTS